jgi:hypothetical protein
VGRLARVLFVEMPFGGFSNGGSYCITKCDMVTDLVATVVFADYGPLPD